MRIMEWNIRHGGSRDCLPGIMASLKQHDPDMICLVEFRQERIIEFSLALASNGWPYIFSSQPPLNTNGILIASKKPMEVIPSSTQMPFQHRWIEVRPIDSNLHILAVQVPSAQDIGRKMAFWRSIRDYASQAIDEKRRSIIIGDLNTGLEMDSEGIGFIGDTELRAILDTGWRDVWREYHQVKREYNWYSSQGKGYRLDHVLISPAIDRPVWAKYSHQERIDGLSDHSPLIFDLANRIDDSGAVQSALR
jgi:exodeoxyribonuclease III